MASFDRILGRSILPFDTEWWAGLKASHERVAIDVGTGSGSYPLKLGATDKSLLCIGIDPVADAMLKNSRRAAAKPAKGGLGNVCYLRAALENFPGPLSNTADIVSVNYPWGSLLSAVTLAEHAGLMQLRSICKSDAELTLYLNYSVYEDAVYSERLGLQGAIELLDSDEYSERYAAAGFKILHRERFDGDPPMSTSWGLHLSRGSQRRSMLIKAVAGAPTGGDPTVQNTECMKRG